MCLPHQIAFPMADTIQPLSVGVPMARAQGFPLRLSAQVVHLTLGARGYDLGRVPFLAFLEQIAIRVFASRRLGGVVLALDLGDDLALCVDVD